MKVFKFYQIILASVFVATPLCILSLKVLSQTPQYQAVSLHEPAFIINTGSLYNCPTTISLLPLGKVTFVVCNKKSAGQIKVKTAMKFFNDILVAEPLSKLPDELCPKSASFGPSIIVKYQGQNSPDISCSDNSKEINLKNDMYSIENEVNFDISPTQSSHFYHHPG